MDQEAQSRNGEGVNLDVFLIACEGISVEKE